MFQDCISNINKKFLNLYLMTTGQLPCGIHSHKKRELMKTRSSKTILLFYFLLFLGPLSNTARQLDQLFSA